MTSPESMSTIGVFSACVLLTGVVGGGGAAGGQGASSRPALRLDGTFIQYGSVAMQLTEDQWHRELDAMRRAKIRVIVLQFLQRQGRPFFADGTTSGPARRSRSGTADPTGVILDYADAHGMEVILGLADDSRWWKQATDPKFLDELGAVQERLAEVLWRRYGRHRSFAGWYIPQEIAPWGFSEGVVSGLRGYLRRVGDTCRKVSGGKPVSIAPFWSGQASPHVVQHDLDRLLDGAGIDVLMLQDMVGARGSDAQVSSVVPYFRAAREACLKRHVELWSDLESFRLVPADPATGRRQGFVPADAGRIGRQLAAEAPFVSRFVTFDFFHYMSPFRGEAQKKLFTDYVREFVDRDVMPASGRQ
jgi:hypothetical protein